MITLAEKLLTGSGAGVLEVNGYVEFVSSTPMTITPKYTNSGVKLLYSLDCTTWVPIENGATTPSANIIYFIGSATGKKSLYSNSLTNNAWTFTGATNLECNGKLDRLLQDDLGGDDDILTIGTNCFSHMFYSQTSLISLDDDCLQATTLANYCYQNMFSNCTGLTTAPALQAIIVATECYYNMFSGCTGLTTAPVLPAMTLANYCYQNMFSNCSNLTTLPELPATTLAPGCYHGMFSSCTKLKLSTTLTGIYDTAYRIPTTGTGTTANSALSSMFYQTGGTFTGTPDINITYYTENTPV